MKSARPGDAAAPPGKEAEGIGGYRLRRQLGLGASGAVHSAAARDGSRVVMRVIAPAALEKPGLRARMLADLEALGRVVHPGVARLLSQGEDQGKRFYVLEDTGDPTLHDLVRRRRPLDEPELLWFGERLASGLAALHAAGLPHGSLGPTAITVGARGPVICDLGWAHRLREVSGEFPADEPPLSVEADLRALASTLLFATAGAGIQPEPGGKVRAPWLSPAVSGIIDQLQGPPSRRPSAERVSFHLGRLAREAAAAASPSAAPPQPAPAPSPASSSPLGSPFASVDESGERPPSAATPSAAPPASPAPPGAAAETATAGAPPVPATLAALFARDGSLETGPAPIDAEAPPLGRFGRYVLLAQVARGGMGIIYKARHADFERQFALKVMLAGALADEAARRRFLHEAEAAAALDHPTIVRVHDCGEVDGRAYLAMDFSEGRPLNQVYKDPARSLDELLALILGATRGVHYAHSRGIIHRDLKPENILVEAGDVPRILDFGVAHRMGQQSGEAHGELVGTPAYMPPEQAEGRGNEIDTRSDVYALGATMFEVATRGRLPFEGKTVTDTLTRILLDDPPAPSSLRANIPWEVDAIILKALAKKREKRYQSAAELADDIERYLQHQPIHARQGSWTYRARKLAERRWRALSVGVVLASLALLGLTVAVGRIRASERDALLQRQAEVADLVARGEAALAARDALGAGEHFVRALGLDAASVPASLGRERATNLKDELDRAAARRRKVEEAQALVAEGQARLAAGDVDQARVRFDQALAYEGAPASAREGRVEVERLIAERDVRALAQRDDGKARLHEAAGQRAMDARDFRAAQAEFQKALAFGSARAQELIAKAEDGLLVERQAEIDRRDAGEASFLAAEAQGALDVDDFDRARAMFHQALGFDGKNAAAQEGLLEVDRLLRARAERDERKARERSVVEQVRLARELRDRGRALFREGSDLEPVREAYFQSLETYDRALFLVPDHELARQEKGATAQEVSLILREEGHYDLADFLLRFGGVKAGAAASPELPQDPNLTILESDKVNIRRAFGGVVRFQPTRVFDRLREFVRAKGDRFRIVIQVRSEITAAIPPAIHAKSLWVNLEDHQQNTVSPVVKIDLEGGPFARQVTVDAQGRIVAPWERSRTLDAQRYIDRVDREARRLLAEAEQRAR